MITSSTSYTLENPSTTLVILSFKLNLIETDLSIIVVNIIFINILNLNEKIPFSLHINWDLEGNSW